MIEPNTKEKQGGTWLCRDIDGTAWKCKREPFNNGLGRWFVKLETHEENYADVMERIEHE